MNTLPKLPEATSVQDVIDNTSTIIAWSCSNSSRIGYFASLYERITKGIETAINTPGVFNSPDLVTVLDYQFANRYFDALNAFFHPKDGYPPLTQSWKVCLTGTADAEPIIVQQLLCAVNAHIDLDLGIATQESVPADQLEAFEADFNTINQVLADQVGETLTEIDALSPLLNEIYDWFGKTETSVIDDALEETRKVAWSFATELSNASADQRPTLITNRDALVAPIGTYILNPSIPFSWLVKLIANKEQRDVKTILNTLSGGACG